MLASWPGWVSVTCRRSPFCLVALALVDALKDGLNGSALQPETWKGLDVLCPAPNVEVSCELVASGLQLVGLNRKLPRLIATLRLCRRSGTPSTIVGIELVAITRL